MRKALPALAALVAVIGLLALFWAMAPAVDPGAGAGEGDEAGPAARSAGRSPGRADPDRDPGPPPGRSASELEDDLVAELRGDRALGLHGGLRRMRGLLDALEAVEVPEIPEGLSAAEEDALIARPIADKAKILSELEIDARVLAGGENALMSARAELLLARGHEHMARFLEDRPVPSYLEGEARDGWLLSLEQRADTQTEKAAAARDRAKEAAGELPADHPFHKRVGE